MELITDTCSSVAHANELFATTEGLLVLIPTRTCQNPFSFTVPSGCYALVTSKGVDLDHLTEGGERSATWPAGLHFPYPPWYQISFLVTKHSVIFEVPIKGCKTRDGISVDVDVGLTFRIMGDSSLGEDSYLVRKFVYQLKPSGLEQQLRGALEAVIRSLVKEFDHSSVYGIRTEETVRDQQLSENEGDGGDESNLLENSNSAFVSDLSTSYSAQDDQKYKTPDRVSSSREITQNVSSIVNIEKTGENASERIQEALNEQFVPQGVQIQSVVMRNVTLPSDVQLRMSQDVLSSSNREEEGIKHFHEMHSARMEEEMSGLLQSYNEGRQHESQIALERINREKVRLEDAIAMSKKAEAQIREETRVRIQGIHERGSYEIQKIKDASDVEASSADKKAKMYSTKIKADTELESQEIISQAHVESEINKAHASKIMATAEGRIAKWVQKRNRFELSLQKIKNLEALADNEDAIISLSSNNDENVINVADSIMKGNDKSASVASVTAEMEILKRVNVVSPEKEEEGTSEQRQA